VDRKEVVKCRICDKDAHDSTYIGPGRGLCYDCFAVQVNCAVKAIQDAIPSSVTKTYIESMAKLGARKVDL